MKLAESMRNLTNKAKEQRSKADFVKSEQEFKKVIAEIERLAKDGHSIFTVTLNFVDLVIKRLKSEGFKIKPIVGPNLSVTTQVEIEW